MNHLQLLDKTKTEFMNYQSCGRHHYAEKLKIDAVFLLNYYSTSELSRELSISVQSLRNWKKVISTNKKAFPAFLPLTLEEDASHDTVLQTEAFILKLPHQLELVFRPR